MTEAKGSITVADKSVDFSIKKGTMGPDVLDIRSLYSETGIFTYDPGFTSTASCESKITFIDGDEGFCSIAAIPFSSSPSTVISGDLLLLLYGELPTGAQKADFDYRITRHTMVHEQMARFFQGFRRDAHPMAVMVASLEHCRRSITTRPISPTRRSGWSPRRA